MATPLASVQLPPRVTVLSGGVGGARYLQGVLHQLHRSGSTSTVTVVANVSDDLWLHGLKVCPDLDTIMYTLGDGIDTDRGWGRRDETWNVKAELAAYGVGPDWFGLGDRDIATHLVRTQMLEAGYQLSDVTAALCQRWRPGVELLPVTNDRVETHVIIDDPDTDQQRAVHFQEYWVRHRATVPAHGVVSIGAETATPAPGVIAAISQADVVLLAPSNPVVSIGAILAIPGIREAIRATSAPVIGTSGIIGSDHVLGMARQMLELIDVPCTATGVAHHYGGRHHGGLLDGWLIDSNDASQLDDITGAAIAARACPLWMSTPAATADMVAVAIELARGVRTTAH